MIEDPRGRIDYDENGDGATAVLVPGSCSTGAAWRPVIAAWQGGLPHRHDQPVRLRRHSRTAQCTRCLDRPRGRHRRGSRAQGRRAGASGGAGTYASWPAKVRSYAEQTTPVNILDWASGYGFPVNPAALAAIDLPTLVLRGGQSHSVMRCVNAALAWSLRGRSRPSTRRRIS